MFVANVVVSNTWREMSEANTGGEMLIQNLNTYVEFIVSETAPDDNTKGGVLGNRQQLSFKKVTGNLYMRSRVENGDQTVHIESVE